MNIYQRINEVRKDVAYIKKDKKVEGYMAVTHDQVTAAIRASLIKHGIIIIPSLVKGVTVNTGTQTKGGTPLVRYDGEYVVQFVNADQPEDCAQMCVSASAIDHGDKAPGKCISYATKTAQLKMLSLETGENEESRIPAEVETVDEEQAANLQALIDEVGEAGEKALFAWLKIDSVSNVPKELYNKAVAGLEKRRQS
jgi:hypothetical protein